MTWGVEGESHPASTPLHIESSVLDGFVVAACAFHLGANPRGPKLAAPGMSCGSRQGVDNMLVPVVQAVRAATSAFYTSKSWCSG